MAGLMTATPTMQWSPRQGNSNSGVVGRKANDSEEMVENRWKNVHTKERMLEIGKRQFFKNKN